MARKNKMSKDAPTRSLMKRASVPTQAESKKSRKRIREESSEALDEKSHRSHSENFENVTNPFRASKKPGDFSWPDIISQLSQHIKQTLQESLQVIVHDSSKKAIAEEVDSFKLLINEVDHNLNSRISTLESSIRDQFNELSNLLEKQRSIDSHEHSEKEVSMHNNPSVASKKSRLSGKISKMKAKTLAKQSSQTYANPQGLANFTHVNTMPADTNNRAIKHIVSNNKSLSNADQNSRIDVKDNGSNKAVQNTSIQEFNDSDYSPKSAAFRFHPSNKLNENSRSQNTNRIEDSVSLSHVSDRAERNSSLSRNEDADNKIMQSRAESINCVTNLKNEGVYPIMHTNSETTLRPLQMESQFSNQKIPAQQQILNRVSSFTGSIGREFKEDVQQNVHTNHQKHIESGPDVFGHDDNKSIAEENALKMSDKHSVQSTSHSDSKYRFDNFAFSFN